VFDNYRSLHTVTLSTIAASKGGAMKACVLSLSDAAGQEAPKASSFEDQIKKIEQKLSKLGDFQFHADSPWYDVMPDGEHFVMLFSP